MISSYLGSVSLQCFRGGLGDAKLATECMLMRAFILPELPSLVAEEERLGAGERLPPMCEPAVLGVSSHGCDMSFIACSTTALLWTRNS